MEAVGYLVGSAFESLPGVVTGSPRLNVFLGIGSWHEEMGTGWKGGGTERVCKREESWVCCKVWWSFQRVESERKDRPLQGLLQSWRWDWGMGIEGQEGEWRLPTWLSVVSMFPGRECLQALMADTMGWGEGGRLGPEVQQGPWGMEADLWVACKSDRDETMKLELEVRKIWYTFVIWDRRTVSWCPA